MVQLHVTNSRVRDFARFILQNPEQFNQPIKFIARKICRDLEIDEEETIQLRYAYTRYEREFEDRRDFDDTITSTTIIEQSALREQERLLRQHAPSMFPRSEDSNTYIDNESINMATRMIERVALLRERENEQIQPKQTPSDKIELLSTTAKYGPGSNYLVHKINEIITKINMNNELNFRESL